MFVINHYSTPLIHSEHFAGYSSRAIVQATYELIILLEYSDRRRQGYPSSSILRVPHPEPFAVVFFYSAREEDLSILFWHLVSSSCASDNPFSINLNLNLSTQISCLSVHQFCYFNSDINSFI